MAMTWFWLNIPLAALFFLAWTLIPLWMVIRHPDTGPPAPGPARRAAGDGTAVTDPAQEASSPALPAQREPGHSDGTGRRPEWAGRSAGELAAPGT
jgi:hypothetical protein